MKPFLILVLLSISIQAQADTLQTCLQNEKTEDGMASCVLMHTQRSSRFVREFETALIDYLQTQERDLGKRGAVLDYRRDAAMHTRAMVGACNKAQKPSNLPGIDDKSTRLACQADKQYSRLEDLKTAYPNIHLTFK